MKRIYMFRLFQICVPKLQAYVQSASSFPNKNRPRKGGKIASAPQLIKPPREIVNKQCKDQVLLPLFISYVSYSVMAVN